MIKKKIEKGNIVKSVGIELPDGKVFKSLQEGESYKNICYKLSWNFRGRQIFEGEMKLKVSKEYFRRLKKVLKSKLNGENLVQGVNTWEVFLLRY